jgi:hypothetical protein
MNAPLDALCWRVCVVIIRTAAPQLQRTAMFFLELFGDRGW